jgi:enediyne biosynthesis protein E4
MTRRLTIPLLVCLSGVLWLVSGCSSKNSTPAVFEVLGPERTGITFANTLKATPAFNMFRYMYFYNGAGVGAGDFNNDGRTDLFFAANQGENRLYLNKGDLRLEDVTAYTRIPQDGGWSTGVSVVDINGDGLLDIYVCRVGQFEVLKGKNQLLVCAGLDEQGRPYYADRAGEYGVDFSGFSTQAAFFDYDGDQDLDLYLMNHSVHQNGTFAERRVFMGTYHPLTGDRLYRNDGKVFTDVTHQSGINSSAIGYGLGIAVSDINLDGAPDLYIGNDFHENDYLYINQRNGTFREEGSACMTHTSQFSMGVDIADVNNDALPEIITMDMLPSDPYILKRSLGEDEYNIFHMKINYGYQPQFARNALQLNRGGGLFSDVAMYAGVHATDWSWAPLWMDFDNDGWKDLFVSNGIPKRLNDIDYVNFVTNEDVQLKIRTSTVSHQEQSIIDKFPQIKLPNKFFRNTGGLSFEDMEDGIRGDRSTFSNGSVYADLDNDGDLDVVVNNIDEPALVYENKTSNAKGGGFVQVHLEGPALNKRAVGARVLVYTTEGLRTYEKYPVHGFQSSMEVPLHIGVRNTHIDSLLLIWPDNTYEHLHWNGKDTRLTGHYRAGLPLFDYSRLTPKTNHTVPPVQDLTRKSGLNYRHRENPFVEFDREPLIPRMVSREGPALAVGDVNGDGLDDVFLGAAKGEKPALFIQGRDGRFVSSPQPALDNDSTYEDVDALWADVNRDGYTDLIVGSGGNEYYGESEYLLPRLYLNNREGRLQRQPRAFEGIYGTVSCIAPTDINGDGYVDLFVGGRAVPWEYGELPRSWLLVNDRKGGFRDATTEYSKELGTAGFVTHALWQDLDRDGDNDLILSLEWEGIHAYMNEKGRLVKKVLTPRRGWWNFTLPVDVDGDGDLDLIAGNTGLNNRLKPSEEQPVRLYYNDFDGNGKKEQVLTYYLQGREIPFANKAELEKQLPILKKRFLYAEDFARASLEELFTREKLSSSKLLSADYFANALLLNDGKMNFTLQALPWEAQLTTYRDALVVDANGDALPDVLLGGNYYDNNIQMSRYDADYGMLLVNKGKGAFACQLLKDMPIKGQVRKLRPFRGASSNGYIVARNNDSALVIRVGPGTTPAARR